MMDESRVVVAGSERALPPAAQTIGPAEPTARTTVTLLLHPRAAAPALLPRATHANVNERTYLTREELAVARGASSADLLAVERFAVTHGLLVLEADAPRRSVIVEGTVRDLEKAFGVSLFDVDAGGERFRGRTGPITVPASLAGLIAGVFGLDERPQARAQFRPAQAATVSYTPLQLAQLYAFPADANGSGETIALIELGGGYNESDLQSYFSSLGLAKTPTVVSVGVDGATNAPQGTSDSADGEVELDIEVVGAIAPAATIAVYFAPNTDQGFLDAITTAIHDTTYRPSIISISWGGPESGWTPQAMTAYDAAFADAALAGITVCCAAGDNGSSDGVTDGLAHVDFPSSSPHVLACGGTSLHASGTTIATETVWNDGTNSATGGGVSDVFALPAWQQNVGVPPSANAGHRIGRGVPDVSGDADPNTGYRIRVDGSDRVFGGTSAVAPLWAALVARLNQRAKKPQGFLAPVIYAHPQTCRDITSGTNGAYAAKAGWDACTGFGSPNGAALAAVTGSASTTP